MLTPVVLRKLRVCQETPPSFPPFPPFPSFPSFPFSPSCGGSEKVPPDSAAHKEVVPALMSLPGWMGQEPRQQGCRP